MAYKWDNGDKETFSEDSTTEDENETFSEDSTTEDENEDEEEVNNKINYHTSSRNNIINPETIFYLDNTSSQSGQVLTSRNKTIVGTPAMSTSVLLTQEEFEHYIKTFDVRCLQLYGISIKGYYKSPELLFSHKLYATNEMINTFLDKLPYDSLFEVKGDFGGSQCTKNYSIVFSFLIGALIEQLDTAMIKRHLLAIAENITVTDELISNLQLALDDFYYAFYLTDKNDKYKSLFTEPKYILRDLAKTSTLIRFKKYMSENKLEPDNYCNEFADIKNTKLKPFFKDYLPTINAIRNRKKTNYYAANELLVLARHNQTKEFMEANCIKII